MFAELAKTVMTEEVIIIMLKQIDSGNKYVRYCMISVDVILSEFHRSFLCQKVLK